VGTPDTTSQTEYVMLPPKEKFEREKVPFQSAYDWMDDERNRVSANTVDGGLYIAGLILSVVIISMAIFN
jgi:hypothetical protein